jgi:hypothetical protein
MPLVIVATPGAANANSFVTAAEMTAYCEGRLNASAWTGANTQLPALVEASRDISYLYWKGSTVTASQALAWPRAYVQDPDAPYDDEVISLDDIVYFPETEVPQRVKDATCELALQYLKAGSTDLAMPDPTDGIVQKQVDVISVTYTDNGSRVTKGLNRFPRVMAFIGPMLAAGAGNKVILRG